MKFKGNIELLGGGASHILNLIPENIAADPTGDALEKGRIIYHTGSNVLKYNQNGTWVTLATGGNTGALQTEIDAIESSLGTMVNSSGVYVPGSLDALGNVTSTPSNDLTDVLGQLDTAITAAAASDSIPSLTDVTITGPAVNDFIVADSNSTYVNLNGTAARSAMGVSIGSDVQAFDATLSALAAFNTNGILVQSAADTFVGRTLVETSSAGLVITNGDGVAGNPSIAMEAGLDSLAGITFAADEMPYTTADNIFAKTALTANARALLDDVSFADMRTTLGLVASGAGDIWLQKSGGTMSGGINMGNNNITNIIDPVNALDAVNKQYADSIASGLDPKNSCHSATTADLGFTYNEANAGSPNVDGVGDTLTASGNGITTVDDIAWQVNDRILVKDQTIALQNGIYTVTTEGTVGATTVLTRALDFDGSPANEVSDGAFTFVQEGTTLANTGWIVVGSAQIDGGDVIVGVDSILFTQSSGAGTLSAGIGLVKNGNAFDVNMGAGIKVLPNDEVGIDVVGSLALQLTGTGTATGDQLTLVLDGTTLSQTSSGIKVAANGISATEINVSAIGNGLLGGGGTVLSVDAAPGIANSLGTITVASNGIGVDLGTSNTTAAPGNHVHAASVVTFAPASTGMSATDVQAAVVELDGRLDSLEGGSSIHASQVEMDATQAGAGLNTDGTYTNNGGANYIAAAGSLDGADIALDTELKAANDRHTKAFFESGVLTAATSHSIAHNTGQKYCNVMVIEEAGGTSEMIIPDGITFTDANNLVVTFTAATSVVVVVTGA